MVVLFWERLPFWWGDFVMRTIASAPLERANFRPLVAPAVYRLLWAAGYLVLLPIALGIIVPLNRLQLWLRDESEDDGSE